jgi:hypothetical protein
MVEVDVKAQFLTLRGWVLCLEHTMNVTKGLDRIALVIAVMAMLPSFIGGMQITYEVLKTETHEYKVWKKEYDKRFSYLLKKESSDGEAITPPADRFIGIFEDKTLESIRAKEPSEKYSYPPMWQRLAGGTIGAVVGLLLVLFTLRGMTRLAVWIIDGFREKTDSQN